MNAINGMTEKLNCREATMADCQQIYKWNSDPVTRANSFNSSVFSFEDHKKWFEDKLKNGATKFFVFANEREQDVGLVRMDSVDDYWLIGLNVVPDHRGKGYAANMIIGAVQKIREKSPLPVIAQIKVENQSSVKVFEKAGFTLDREIVINNIPSLQYVYENS
ncbi:MAG: GNAT family N-acetyltransferase [Bacteroidia bacterium]